ncbi:HAMP domain-containing sensor histidine kinase [Streptosporangium sp. NPDC051023]|uniref:sensor histidine kinase n=1 Tax=Streptosporangium sp. NPDC051023 TaxID=3155410 RepID=UPI00344CF65D
MDVNDLDDRATEATGTDEIVVPAQMACVAPGQLEDLRRRVDRLLVQQRQFVSDASHELLTPIAGLRAQLEEARLHPDATDPKELIERALTDIDRLQTIVTDLLVLARTGTSIPDALTPVDLAELVRTTPYHRTGDALVLLRLAPGVTANVVDHEIHRAFRNLLDNAQRHARHMVLVELRRNEDHAELVVTDDGDGIPEEDRRRVFERFSRLDKARARAQGGTGLGLAIVRDIVHAHGGTIEVGEAEAGGARFVLRLPLAAGPAPDRQPLERQACEAV